jgi:hypothetical protein
MKISPTLSDLHHKKDRKLPGETRPFVPKKGSLRNLVPPQQLVGGAIVSGRDHEVGHSDPLLLRIRELEAECKALRKRLEELQ